MKNYSVQVDKELYLNSDYMSVARFLSYREQVLSVMAVNGVNSVLEIGKGNGITSSLLRNFEKKIKTLDFDADLNPDIIGSILDTKSISNEKYDAVLCFQVLEHLEYKNFSLALKNMKKMSSKYVFISLPYAGYGVRLQAYLSRCGERSLSFVFRVPMFWKKHVFNGEHYWEPGKRYFSRRTIRTEISKCFKIESEWLLPYNKSQIFYRCRVLD